MISASAVRTKHKHTYVVPTPKDYLCEKKNPVFPTEDSFLCLINKWFYSIRFSFFFFGRTYKNGTARVPHKRLSCVKNRRLR